MEEVTEVEESESKCEVCLIDKLDADSLSVVLEFLTFEQRFQSVWRVSTLFSSAHSRAAVYAQRVSEVVERMQESIPFCCVSDIIRLIKKHRLIFESMDISEINPRVYFGFLMKEEMIMNVIMSSLRKLHFETQQNRRFLRVRRDPPLLHSLLKSKNENRWLNFLLSSSEFPCLTQFGIHSRNLELFVHWLMKEPHSQHLKELTVYGKCDRISDLCSLKNIQTLIIHDCHMVIADDKELYADFTHLNRVKVSVDEYSTIPVALLHPNLIELDLSLHCIIAPMLDPPLIFHRLKKLKFKSNGGSSGSSFYCKPSTFALEGSAYSSSISTGVRTLDEEFDLMKNLIIEYPGLMQECYLESVTYNQALCVINLCPNGHCLIEFSEPMTDQIRAQKWIDQFKSEYREKVMNVMSEESGIQGGMKSLTLVLSCSFSFDGHLAGFPVLMHFLRFIDERMIPWMTVRLRNVTWQRFGEWVTRSAEEEKLEHLELIHRVKVERDESVGCWLQTTVDLYFDD